MQIATDVQNIGGRYHVQVSTPVFSATEEQLMNEFGEPTVDVGGSITDSATRPGGDPISVTITLPSSLRRIRSDFPSKQVFDLADSANSDIMAEVWRATMVARLTTAKSTLVAKSSPFEGQALTTV